MSFLSYPMTDEQKKLLLCTHELATTFAGRAAAKDWQGHFPAENFADLHQAGYLGLTVPRELGGWGASMQDVVHAQYTLAQGDASTALVASMHLIHIGRLIETGQSEYPPLVRQICQDIIEHGAMINSAVSEPATGSPSRGGQPQTTAYRQADGSWRIRGRKSFTTGSYALHYFIVGCSIVDESDGALEPLREQRGNFLVPQSTAGVRIEQTWNSLSMRGTGSNDVILEDVHVGPENYLDVHVPVKPVFQARQGVWGMVIAAVYLGIAAAARNEALRFARSRRPNSLQQSIATVPHIQDKLGRIEVALLESQALLFGLAEQYSHDPASISVVQVGAAKYLVTNRAVEIVDMAMRVVGAASLALTSPLQRYYRDVRAGLHNPPMDDAALAALAKQALEKQGDA